MLTDRVSCTTVSVVLCFTYLLTDHVSCPCVCCTVPCASWLALWGLRGCGNRVRSISFSRNI